MIYLFLVGGGGGLGSILLSMAHVCFYACVVAIVKVHVF